MHSQSRHSLKRPSKEPNVPEYPSLLPEPPRAIKDCRVCNRRRIKCDRTTPSCKKCAAKKLTCPGYGLNLTWQWGVASRGKLAGKKIPTVHSEEDFSSQASETPSSPIASREIENKHSTVIHTKDSPISESSWQFQAEHTPNWISVSRHDSNGFMEGGSDTSSFLDFQTSSYSPMFSLSGLTSGILQESHPRRRLFDHYCKFITGSMVWVDVPDNPWRKVIMPMAIESPPLLISVLAFAAEHLSALLPENIALKDTLMRCAGQYRDAALTLITSDMRSATIASGGMTAETNVSHKNDLSNSVLASMLILCNMETVRPDSKLWQLHLNAARTIINIRRNTPSPQDEIFNFLVQQFFITDVFACTTSFEPIEDHDILTDDAGSIFIEFLRLIRRVTWLERLTTTQGIPISGAGISSSRMRTLFEQARDRTLALSTNTPFATPTEREQFLSIVHSFHYAGLLYSYRCLSYPDADEDILESREELFHSLNLVESDKSAFAQDICWPLFIAGTEAESTDGRNLVEQKLKQAMKSTGFSNCVGALAFLRELWRARDGEENCLGLPNDYVGQESSRFKLNWIQCARYWTSQGHQFFVI